MVAQLAVLVPPAELVVQVGLVARVVLVELVLRRWSWLIKGLWGLVQSQGLFGVAEHVQEGTRSRLAGGARAASLQDVHHVHEFE